MRDTFEEQNKLELYKLEYSEQHASKYGYHTGTVNGKLVKYTNVKALLMNGEAVYSEDGYAWKDKQTVMDVCVGYPENHTRHCTPEGQQIDRFARQSLDSMARPLFAFR